MLLFQLKINYLQKSPECIYFFNQRLILFIKSFTWTVFRRLFTLRGIWCLKDLSALSEFLFWSSCANTLSIRSSHWASVLLYTINQSNQINPSIHQSINPSIHQSINSSIHHFDILTIWQSINPSIHLFINPSIHQSINSSVHQSINPSIN